MRSATLARQAFGRAEGDFVALTRHLCLSALARLGNVPGYYRSSLPGRKGRKTFVREEEFEGTVCDGAEVTFGKEIPVAGRYGI